MKSLQNHLYCICNDFCFFFLPKKPVYLVLLIDSDTLIKSPQIILNNFCRLHDWGLKINSEVLINHCEITMTVLCYELSDWSVALQAFKDPHPQANTITAHQYEQLAMKISQHCNYLHVLCCSLVAHHCMG